MVVRELTGGIYFGKRELSSDGKSAYDTMQYSVSEVERIAIKAFEIAMKREKRVVIVSILEILLISRLWRKTVEEVATRYPEVTLSHCM